MALSNNRVRSQEAKLAQFPVPHSREIWQCLRRTNIFLNVFLLNDQKRAVSYSYYLIQREQKNDFFGRVNLKALSCDGVSVP